MEYLTRAATSVAAANAMVSTADGSGYKSLYINSIVFYSVWFYIFFYIVRPFVGSSMSQFVFEFLGKKL